MSKTEKRARHALQCHKMNRFWRDYDDCFEMGDGREVAKIMFALAEQEGVYLVKRHLPEREVV